MSLKTFHICFLTISSILMIYVGSWSYIMWDYYANNAYISYLVFSILSLIGLIVYGRYFFKNYKNI